MRHYDMENIEIMLAILRDIKERGEPQGVVSYGHYVHSLSAVMKIASEMQDAALWKARVDVWGIA